MSKSSGAPASGLSYGLVTPVRDEEQNLERLATCVLAQTILPSGWIIVDNGSTDGTVDVAADIAASHTWITVVSVPGATVPTRGGAVVRAFNTGLNELAVGLNVIVKLDADVSFEPDHFEHLLERFASDPRLGIASSLCLEEENGNWRARHSTRSHARGAVRAYRRECLEEVLPLEERMGWDGIDELKAAVRGWDTATIHEIVFFHHRKTGERERPRDEWLRQGHAAHYMGYRPSYLAIRALFRAVREPRALAMVWGYATSAVRRSPRYPDPEVRAWLRREQSLRRLPRRAREALGRSETTP
jgi:biofilm PGA synthesis N-glycosyltransferase PgaC